MVKKIILIISFNILITQSANANIDETAIGLTAGATVAALFPTANIRQNITNYCVEFAKIAHQNRSNKNLTDKISDVVNYNVLGRNQALDTGLKFAPACILATRLIAGFLTYKTVKWTINKIKQQTNEKVQAPK